MIPQIGKREDIGGDAFVETKPTRPCEENGEFEDLVLREEKRDLVAERKKSD